MEIIRKLDRVAERPGMVVALTSGALGMVLIAAAYPLYQKITKAQREKAMTR